MIDFRILNEGEAEAALPSMLKEYAPLLAQAKKGEEVYEDSSGWLDPEKWASESHLREWEDLAAQIRQDADVFVLVGVGGSNNAARSVIEALGDKKPEIVYAGNSLSAREMTRLLASLEGKSVYINCIAKNFETLEPGLSFRLLRKYMKERYGAEAKKRIIATGTAGSPLEVLCREQGYRFLEFPEDVGGRYSAMSAVGLFPMAVAGIDIRRLVKGAKSMRHRLLRETEYENIAYRYACLRNLYYRLGYRIEMLSFFEPAFRYFQKWWIQLFAESEGKKDKGVFPVGAEFSEELHAVGQFVQEGTPIIFETFLVLKNAGAGLRVEPDEIADGFSYLDGWEVEAINRAALDATVQAHGKRLPCLWIEADCPDAFGFGELFYYFQFAAYLSCKIMGVDPFNQPGVEAYKVRMFKALKKGERKS